jgi:prepilin-type N-terminal cleavage/methylation domain-containing protein
MSGQNLKKIGFSIPELLISIVVLGILTTIGLISWNGYQQKVAEDAVKHDLGTAVSAMESARNFGEGYPGSLPGTFEPGESVSVQYEIGDLQSFCLSGQHINKVEILFHVEQTGVIEEGPCL